jgi:uncharacterized protein YegP (UPF0339 family)
MINDLNAKNQRKESHFLHSMLLTAKLLAKFQMYSSVSSMEYGIGSVKKNAHGATAVERK